MEKEEIQVMEKREIQVMASVKKDENVRYL